MRCVRGNAPTAGRVEQWHKLQPALDVIVDWVERATCRLCHGVDNELLPSGRWVVVVFVMPFFRSRIYAAVNSRPEYYLIYYQQPIDTRSSGLGSVWWIAGKAVCFLRYLFAASFMALLNWGRVTWWFTISSSGSFMLLFNCLAALTWPGGATFAGSVVVAGKAHLRFTKTLLSCYFKGSSLVEGAVGVSSVEVVAVLILA